ncbi:MAG: tRNA-dihydrouridine synthase, partial [Alphaproteobacteria bacterium]|nr:tRNA-dihydrouridine synthase [Alphaproteobacteria bacterium]
FINQVAHYIKTKEILPDPSYAEQLEVIMNHYDAMIELYGADAGVRMARKHLGWYSSGIPHSAELRGKINMMTDYKEVKKVFADFYSKLL